MNSPSHLGTVHDALSHSKHVNDSLSPRKHRNKPNKNTLYNFDAISVLKNSSVCCFYFCLSKLFDQISSYI